MQANTTPNDGWRPNIPRTCNSFDTSRPVNFRSKFDPIRPQTHNPAVKRSESIRKSSNKQLPQNFTDSTPNIWKSEASYECENTQLGQRQTNLWTKVRFHQTGQNGQRKQANHAMGTKQEKKMARSPVSAMGSKTDSVYDGSCLLSSTTHRKQTGSKHPSFWPSSNLLLFRQIRGNRRPNSHQTFSLHRDRTESSIRTPLPRRIRSCRKLKFKPSFADLRTQAMAGQVTEIEPHFNHSGTTLNLSHLEQPAAPLNRSTSPVPTLHDPVKDRCFMEECHELIIKLGKSWDASMPKDGLHDTKDGLVDGQHLHNSPPRITARNNSPVKGLITTSQQQIAPPVPPKRNSSRYRTRLAPSINASQNSCLPVLNGSTIANHVENTSTRGSNILNWPRTTDGPTGFSDAGRSNQPRLKHFKSADTIAAIEAQVQHSLEAPLMIRMKRESTGKLSLGRSSRPSGEPPEKPLPELPNEDHMVTSWQERNHQFNNGHSTNPEAVIEANNSVRRTDLGEDVPLMLSYADSLASMRTTCRYNNSKASIYGQNIASTNPYLHQATFESKTTNPKLMPAVEVSPKRRGGKPIFASPTYRREGTNDSDELDQFPPVPHTRSSSRDEVSPKSSPRKPYPLRVSQLNSMLHNPIPLGNKGGYRVNRQRSTSGSSETLTRSRIMVIVDTDPRQEYGFRAGTVSPDSDRPSSRDDFSTNESLSLSQSPPAIGKLPVRIKPNHSYSNYPDSNREPYTQMNSYRLRIKEDISRQKITNASGHVKRTSRGRVIIEASDEEDNIGPHIQIPIQQTLPSSRHRRCSSIASSADTSLSSVSKEKYRWKEFCQTAKQDYDEWRQVRNTMKQDLDGLFRDLKMTNIVLGRMAHVGRAFPPMNFDVAAERETLLGAQSTRGHDYSYTIAGSTSRGIKQRQRGNVKPRLVGKTSKESMSEGKRSIRIRAHRGQYPTNDDSAYTYDSTGTESDGSTVLFGPLKESRIRKQSSNDSLTDPRDYDCEPHYPDANRGKKLKQASSTMDQTVIKAASMSAIRRTAKHDSEELLPHPLRNINRSTTSTPVGREISAGSDTKMLPRPFSPEANSSPATFRHWQPAVPHSLDELNEPKQRFLDINHTRQLSSDDMDRAIDLFKVYT